MIEFFNQVINALFVFRYEGLVPHFFLGQADINPTTYIISIVSLCAIAGIISYFLGALNFAIIISKYKFGEDIRTYGSGNAGMTNMLRTYGKGAAAFTLLGDIAKAAVSVIIGMLLAGDYGVYIAGIFCVIGHSFPCYYGFKGGKGIVVTYTTIFFINPLILLIILLLFVALVASTKYLSLGSIIVMLLYPILLNRLYLPLHGAKEHAVAAIVSVLNALFVVWLHRENIKRLLSGKENKFSLKKKDKFVKAEKEADEK